jgi:ABC-type antimicrobial peptide transport system permease subunit
MQRYETARTVLAFLEVIAWLAIAIGIAAGFFLGVQSGQGALITGALVAVPTLIAGLLVIALVQLAGAQLDTASNTADLLTLLREQIKGANQPPG